MIVLHEHGRRTRPREPAPVLVPEHVAAFADEPACCPQPAAAPEPKQDPPAKSTGKRPRKSRKALD